MASLSAPYRGRHSNDGQDLRPFEITNAEVVYQGGYYGLSAAGYLTEMADTASLKPLGILKHFGRGCADAGGKIPDSVTGATSNTPIPHGVVDIEGGVIGSVDVTGATTIANVGDLVYLSTDNPGDFTVTVTTNTPAVGEIIYFYSATSFDIRLFSLAEMTAQTLDIQDFAVGVFETTVLEGTAAITLSSWTAPRAGKIISAQLHPTGFDAGYVAGAQTAQLAIATTATTGGLFTLGFGDIDDAASAATPLSPTALTALNVFAAGEEITLDLVASGTGFTAAIDNSGYTLSLKVRYA